MSVLALRPHLVTKLLLNSTEFNEHGAYQVCLRASPEDSIVGVCWLEVVA